MKNIKFALTILFTLSLVKLPAQKLIHNLGTNISLVFGKINTPYVKESFLLKQTYLVYFPRYNFVEKENSSFSLGLPIGLGAGFASSTSGDAGLYFAYDLPIVFDYNFGMKSTSENEKRFGGFMGIGFGYSKVNISNSQYSDYTGTSYGPILRGGFRFPDGRSSDKALTLGLFYKKGLDKDKFSTAGFIVTRDL